MRAVKVPVTRTQRVTQRMWELGYTATGLWRRCQRETGETFSYSKFMAVCAGRLRSLTIELWLEKNGFGDELRQSQMDQVNRRLEKAKQKVEEIRKLLD